MSGISARPPAFGQLFSAPTRPPSPVTLPFPAWRAQDGLLDGARAPRGLRRALVCARGESQQCADLPFTPLAESRSAVWQVLDDSQRRFVMVSNAAKGASAQVCTSICARADRSCRASQPPVMARSMGGQSHCQRGRARGSTCEWPPGPPRKKNGPLGVALQPFVVACVSVRVRFYHLTAHLKGLTSESSV